MLAKQTKHENYGELIWMLAKTDFKLRYQGSFLGYIWALLKPLALFAVLNFVFSSIFARGLGVENYALQLLVSLMLFMFFSEGTNAGMNALKAKSSLVTKIYLPRWTIILAATIHSLLVFLTNVLIIFVFFAWYQFVPSLAAIGSFFLFALAMYIVVLAYSFFAAPLILRFKDIGLVWEIVLRVLFYGVPIMYPLTMLPAWSHQWILLNPVAFIIHFNKESMFSGRHAEVVQYAVFVAGLAVLLAIGVWTYRKLEPKIAEYV